MLGGGAAQKKPTAMMFSGERRKMQVTAVDVGHGKAEPGVVWDMKGMNSAHGGPKRFRKPRGGGAAPTGDGEDAALKKKRRTTVQIFW